MSEVRITVLGEHILNLKTKAEKFIEAEPFQGLEMPIVIDGIRKKQTVKRIVINQLCKNDGEQASIPI